MSNKRRFRAIAGWGIVATWLVGGVHAQPQTKPIKRPKDNQLALEKLGDSQSREPQAASAATAIAERLTFHVSPLSSQGLLSEQIREALKALDKANGNATLIQLRAFVAGTGDLRRVQSIVAELFDGKKTPMPIVTTVRVGSLGAENAQIVIDSVSEAKKSVNLNGLAFYSGQAGASGAEAVERLASAMGSQAADALRVSCFANSAEQAETARFAAAKVFAKAAGVFMQTSRFDSATSVHCEGISRAGVAGNATRGKIVFAATQMAFGDQDSDVQLALDRLQKSVQAAGGNVDRPVTFDAYALNPTVAANAQRVLAKQTSLTVGVFEALPSLDATLALEMVAAAK